MFLCSGAGSPGCGQIFIYTILTLALPNCNGCLNIAYAVWHDEMEDEARSVYIIVYYVQRYKFILAKVTARF